MDMNKRLTYLMHRRTRRTKGDSVQLAAQLAPLEEQKKNSAQRDGKLQAGAHMEPGAIVVDNSNVGLSEDIVESKEGKLLGMDLVVVVIVCIVLAFIAFIAWQISQMPQQ
jgi:hypothetical protein